MPNEIIFFLTVLIFLGAVPILYKFFGKNGLYAYAVFATLFSNIAVCKSIDLFGFSSTAGNVLYASTFLVTDILSEKYGKKAAANCVKYSLCTMLLWLIGTQLILWFTPNASDYIDSSLQVVFGIVPRITAGSFIGFSISQSFDVFLYHYIWKKTGNNNTKLWLRNNVGTLTSQLLDTLIFTFIAFWGVYSNEVFISILITTYLFKAIVALLDTPFLYLARKLKPMEEESHA